MHSLWGKDADLVRGDPGEDRTDLTVDTGQGAQPLVAMSELPTPLVVSRRVDVVTRKTSHRQHPHLLHQSGSPTPPAMGGSISSWLLSFQGWRRCRRGDRRGLRALPCAARSRAPISGRRFQVGRALRRSEGPLTVTPPERSALAHSICPRCQRAKTIGSLTSTIRSSPKPGSVAHSSASPRSMRSHAVLGRPAYSKSNLTTTRVCGRRSRRR